MAEEEWAEPPRPPISRPQHSSRTSEQGLKAPATGTCVAVPVAGPGACGCRHCSITSLGNQAKGACDWTRLRTTTKELTKDQVAFPASQPPRALSSPWYSSPAPADLTTGQTTVLLRGMVCSQQPLPSHDLPLTLQEAEAAN